MTFLLNLLSDLLNLIIVGGLIFFAWQYLEANRAPGIPILSTSQAQ